MFNTYTEMRKGRDNRFNDFLLPPEKVWTDVDRNKNYTFCIDCNADTLLWNLKERSLADKEHGTLETWYPLWFTIRPSVSYSDTPFHQENTTYLSHGKALWDNSWEVCMPLVKVIIVCVIYGGNRSKMSTFCTLTNFISFLRPQRHLFDIMFVVIN